MHYLYEALIVGIYTSIIFLCNAIYVKNIVILLFLTGFIKHFMGYFLQIHYYYCNYGYKCNKKKQSVPLLNAKFKPVFIQSIMEGLLFVIINYIFFNVSSVWQYRCIVIFLSSVLIHIIAEYTNVHSYFCKNNCYKIKGQPPLFV
jgi:hypothetical protein